MKFTYAAVLAAFIGAQIMLPARAYSEPTLESLATCKDSWLDWKENPAADQKFAENLHTNFSAGKEGAILPKTPQTLLGLPITRVYPESLGMGVGFSVGVTGGF